MTNSRRNAVSLSKPDMLTGMRLQAINSRLYSAQLLKEAKRLLKQQRKEHAPLLKNAKARKRYALRKQAQKQR